MLAFVLLAAIPGPGQAEEWNLGRYLAEPNPVLRITEALAKSKQPQLEAHLYEDGGREFSHALVSVRYLGTISRAKETLHVATALFVRSAAKGSEHPSPRQHGFLLCLDPEFRMVSVCSLDFPDEVLLIGEKLTRLSQTPGRAENGMVIADLSESSDTTARRVGFLIDGAASLPYPFSSEAPSP